jgi:hypothetical protein
MALRTRTPPVPTKVRVIAAAIVLVLGGWGFVARQDRVRNQNRLAAIASQISGRQVSVHCPGMLARALTDDAYETESGSVRFDAEGMPSNETKLAKRTCSELDAIAEGRRATQLACAGRSVSCGDDVQLVAHSVDVIAHESYHLKGITSEGITECFSLQKLAWTAMQLGATEDQARGLARLQFETNYTQMPEQYRASGCSEGGALDLHPDDPRFP